MIIGSAQNLKEKVRDSPVMLNGKTIPSTDSFECLGVIIDKRLLWDKHIEKICKKVGAGIAVETIETMRLIYNALIQPYFDYCSPLWDSCCAYLKEKLQKFQNRAARIIAGASYEIPSADVLETLGWEALEVRRKRNKAILMYRILNNQGASSLKESFTRISALEINYNLRNSSTDLVLPHPKREVLKNSFKLSGAKLWNSLPLQAKLAQSEYTFKMNISSLA